MSYGKFWWIAGVSLLGCGLLAGSAEAKPKRGPGQGGNPQMQQQLLQKFDKNGNGQLDPDEKQAAMQAMQQRKGAGGKPKK